MKIKTKIINRRMLRNRKLDPMFCHKAYKYTYKYTHRVITTCGGNRINDKLHNACQTCRAYDKNVNRKEYVKESEVFLYMEVNK